MARALDAIIKELDAGYNPSRDIINQQIKALPQQAESEIGGLKATQAQSFDNILAGARQRGLGFSGIPLQEQAQYTSSQFLPAVARVKQAQNESKTSLLSALADLGRQQRESASSIFQKELDRDEQIRQFNAQLQAQRDAEARAAAASRSSGGGGYSYSGGGATAATKKAAAPQVQVPPQLQQLFNQVFIKGNGTRWDDRSLVSDYNATLQSAKYGNTRDKQKLQLYHSVRPDLFGSSVPAAVLGNGGKLSY